MLIHIDEEADEQKKKTKTKSSWRNIYVWNKYHLDEDWERNIYTINFICVARGQAHALTEQEYAL